MTVRVTADGILAAGNRRFRCALGRGGITLDKREGDGATPAGDFPLRQVLYRADRVSRPKTGLPVTAIAPDDGWCDAPGDRNYNRAVKHPYPASAERLWRDDGLYDLVVVVGYNDDPVQPRKGSAIFIHVAAADFTPTEGCVALAMPDLLALLQACGSSTRLLISAP